MKNLKEKLKNLEKSAFTGIFASAALTLLWLALFGQRSVKMLALAVFGTAVVIFILKIIYELVMEKLGIKRRFLANELFILFALMAFLGVAIRAFAPVMLFAPADDKKARESLAAYMESQKAEELKIDADFGTLYGWFLKNAQGSAATVLYFGANSETSSVRVLELLEDNQKLSAFGGCNFAYIDYPEYGKSGGAASEKSFKQMGLYAYDYLMNRDDVGNIVLMGYGIGSGVANYVAGERQPLGLILIAPYAEGSDLYNSYADIFHGPLKALVSFKMRAVKFAEKVDVTPLLLVSKNDGIIPYKSSVRLFERYKNGGNFVTIDDAAHYELWEKQEVLDEIKKYLAR